MALVVAGPVHPVARRSRALAADTREKAEFPLDDVVAAELCEPNRAAPFDDVAPWYRNVHDYTFRHFPDPRYGEWFALPRFPP